MEDAPARERLKSGMGMCCGERFGRIGFLGWRSKVRSALVGFAQAIAVIGICHARQGSRIG
jgi:hypothetical protein